MTRPSFWWTAVTLTSSTIFAPRWRAPLASAMAMLAGSHWPSSGRCTAPTTPSMLRCGYICLTSAGEISRTSTSKARATDGLAVELVLALLGQRHRDRADLAHAGGDAGLGLELDVEIGRIFRQPRHVLRAAQLADQAGGMPGRAGGQLLALQQHDVGPAELGQVIGDRAAGDAAADDDGAGLWRGGRVMRPCFRRRDAKRRSRVGGLRSIVVGLAEADADVAGGGLAEARARHDADLFAVEQGPGEFLVVGLDGARCRA